MKFKINLFIASVLVLFSACTKQPVASRQNRSYEYKPKTAVTHTLRSEGDTLHFYLHFADKAFFAFPQNMQVAYTASLNYEKPQVIFSDSLRRPASRIMQMPEGVMLDFKIARNKLKMPAVLLVKVFSGRNPDNIIWHDIQLTPELTAKNYILVDARTNLPLFQDYVLINQPFIIAQTDVPMPGEMKRFEANFTAALPPMAAPEAKPQSLKKLSTIPFYTDTLRLAEKGLYSIEIGGKPVGGILVEENSFPELTSAEELIRPLIYLTTSKERDKLYNAKEPKAAVDQFWLDIVPDQNQARHLIRTYYERVTDANRFFSAHKGGWLTDRGMIYITFGPPENVNRFADREEWNYPGDSYRSGVKFVFLKKPNTFTQNHFELVRSRYLEGFWYRTVEQWRTGTIDR